MTYSTKYRIANTVAILSLLVAAKGLSTLVSEARAEQNTVPGALFLFMTVAAGTTAAVCRQYYKSRRDAPVNQQKIAVETLAKIAEKKDKEQKRWHS